MSEDYTGIIIEESLLDTRVLDGLEILKTWDSGEDDDLWHLYKVSVSKDQITQLSSYIRKGWYMHFWAANNDDMFVVYKDKVFRIRYTDKNTWRDAVEYGLQEKIIREQLTFPIQ